MHERGLIGLEPGGGEPPERDGRRHADEGNEHRGWAHAQQGLQIDLETDVEKQHQHADLGQKGQGVIGARVGEHLHTRQNQGEVAEPDPSQQLAEYRRLSETLGQHPPGLGGQNQDGDGKEQRAERRMFGAGRRFADGGGQVDQCKRQADAGGESHGEPAAFGR